MPIHGNDNRYPIVENPHAKNRILAWDHIAGKTIQIPLEVIASEEGFTLQDNIRRIVTTFGQGSQNYNVHDLINNSQFLPLSSDHTADQPRFTVSEIESLIVKVPRSSRTGNRALEVFDYYLLKEVGKGTYGGGGDTHVVANNFLFLRTTQTIVISSNTPEPPVIYDIYTEEDYEIPHLCVNTEDQDFEVVNTKDYYFKIYTLDGARAPDIPDYPYHLYRFIGGEGNYGTIGGDSTFSTDFELVEAVGETPIGTTIRTVNIASVIEKGTSIENISEALKDGFRGILNIESDEIVLFKVFRKIGNTLIFEQYYWKNGKAENITADCEPSDFEVDYKESIGKISLETDTKNGDTKIYNVFSTDKATPEVGLNLNVPDLLFDSDDSNIYVLSRVYDDTLSDIYNLYKYTGVPTTYGASSGNAAVNGDFELIDTIGDVSNPPTTSEGILKVRRIIVGSVINGTDIVNDDISKAINRSFRSQIKINPDELLIFEAHRKITDSDSKDSTLLLEKYRWMGRTNLIDSDTVLADFDLDFEKKAIAELPTDKTETPQVNPVPTVDINLPEVALNNASATYIISATEDFYFVIYNENITSLDYKIYKYIGAIQSIGSGGVTVVNGDFEEVTEVNDDTTPYYMRGTSFLNVGTGTYNQVPEKDAYRLGKIAIGKTTVNELFEVDGNETGTTGGVNLKYTQTNGRIIELSLGGEDQLSDLSIPASGVSGMIARYSGDTNYPTTTTYVALGDYDLLGAQKNFGLTMGLAKADASAYALMFAQALVEDNEDEHQLKFKSLSVDGDFAYYHLNSKGYKSQLPILGFANEPLHHFYVKNNEGDDSEFLISPHLFSTDNLFKIGSSYGDGTFTSNYVHTDTLAKTGTTETTLGTQTFGLGVDASGYIIAVPKAGGLEEIDEGNGIGWRLIGKDPTKHRDIGLNAVDFSQNVASEFYGAIGENSFAVGFNVLAQGLNSVALGGQDIRAIGEASFVGGGYGNFANGIGSSVIGSQTSIAEGSYSAVLAGYNATAYSYAEVVIGRFQTIYAPTSSTSWDSSDKLFVVGCGSSAFARADAFTIYKDGTITAPSLTTALIDTAGDKALVTKEYGDTNYANPTQAFGGCGMIGNATETVINTAGVYENITGTFVANASLSEVTANASGLLTYTGSADRHFHIVCNLDMLCVSNNQTLKFKWFKNGLELQIPMERRITTGTDIGSASIHADVMLSTSDTLQLKATNITSTANITIQNIYKFILGMV